ncbi:PREDICTED: X-box-binding protein 1 [Tauraco erythrolophus]|uniref:X-box-binding protein 1 n=1 Tax=Tauraco erythrolophus TaxID=121530 RepID=UPI000523EE69|nr:PREDICTED: X-box-binding protein 1 [Tauraco erythrolophus]
MDSDGSDSSDSESDLLLGFLDSLDPEMFLKCADSESTCLEKLEEEICGETNSIPTSPSPSLGSPSAKLEAINELIRFDHVYTKPLILEIPVKTGSQTNMLVKIEEVSISPSEDKAIPEVPVSVKEEPVDSFMPQLGISHLLPSHHSLAASSYLLDACSDSGYDGSLSPFSDMSSPLDTDHAWEDSFANELLGRGMYLGLAEFETRNFKRLGLVVSCPFNTLTHQSSSTSMVYELIPIVDEVEFLAIDAISLEISQVIEDFSQSGFTSVMFSIKTAFSVHLDKLL